jgi:formylmethanofuran dehydrogenase subunit C
MRPLILTLRGRLDHRLDLSLLVPHTLAGKTVRQIERMELQTSHHPITLGDVFRVRAGDIKQIHIQGDCDRFDYVGQEMNSGELLVEGNVGIQAGRLMSGGRLTVLGNTGPWAASGMKSGVLEIRGAAGDRLGGPLAGEITGMRGGIVIVRGSVGERAGDRMRRGTIIIEGQAGRYAGSRMIAGTLIVRRSAGPLAGFLLKRGTIVLGECYSALSPTFMDCGEHELIAMRWLSAMVRPYSKAAAVLLQRPFTRFAGDMAVLGKGEILVGNRN